MPSRKRRQGEERAAAQAENRSKRRRAESASTDSADPDAEEFEPDEGRRGSRDFQQNAFGSVEYHLSKERDQSKKFLNDFKNGASEMKQETLALVSHLRDQIATPQSASVARLQKTCRRLVPTEAARTGKRSRGSLKLFQHSTRVLATFKAVLHAYDAAEAHMPTTVPKLPEGDWNRDVNDITQVLGLARQYGLQLAETAVITRHSMMKPELDSTKLSEAESLAIELFERGHGGLVGETWGQVAHRQVRALERACAILAEVPDIIPGNHGKAIRGIC